MRAAQDSKRNPLEDVSTWRSIFEPSTVTSGIERKRGDVRILSCPHSEPASVSQQRKYLRKYLINLLDKPPQFDYIIFHINTTQR